MTRVAAVDEIPWSAIAFDPASEFVAEDDQAVLSQSFFGQVEVQLRGPQCFRAKVPVAGHVIRAHFHPVDQFQVVVGGGGTIGRHPYDPISVHYVDSYTPYGPVTMGDAGLEWFTFRTHADVGAFYVPESREFQRRRAGRFAEVALAPTRPVPDARSVVISSVIEEADDGLAAFELVAGPDAGIKQSTARGSGRYELVLAGSLIVDDKSLALHSVMFSGPGERLVGRAGPDGVRLLSLQLPTA